MADREFKRVVVAGGGAWGTALAALCTRSDIDTTLWCRSEDQAERMRELRQNKDYLPGFRLPDGLDISGDAAAFGKADLIILATPAQSTREMLAAHFAEVPAGVPVVVSAKGLERGSDMMLTDVMGEAAPHLVPMVLSGPSFAADVMADLPTAVTLAGADTELCKSVAQAIGRPSFRIYASDDLAGVQVGGAVKNVIAIAAGICAGKRFGASALAALTTRSFAELRRLAHVLGAKPDTLFGLSGLGDLMLTCSSMQSRNYSLGFELAQGLSLEAVLASRKAVSEGVYTASVVRDLAARHSLDMPVCEAVAKIVVDGADVDAEIHRLLARPLKAETD